MMELTPEEGRRIVYDDHVDWSPVGTEDIIDNRRWVIRCCQVFEHLPSGKHYQLSWSEGATEVQDERPFECEQPDPIEVVWKEVTIKQWVPVEK
jgi:hypothetical protein